MICKHNYQLGIKGNGIAGINESNYTLTDQSILQNRKSKVKSWTYLKPMRHCTRLNKRNVSRLQTLSELNCRQPMDILLNFAYIAGADSEPAPSPGLLILQGGILMLTCYTNQQLI